ncbi:MAG: ABC transporter substrate-binding protein, partial [Sciscionella sp.]
MRRPGKALPALALGLILLAGCTQAPPPAPVVSSTPATPTVTPKVDLKQAVVGVDTVAGGYNPHQIADQSTVTTALASMMLPSVFHSTADGVLRLDRSVMLAAKVTSAAPFTVTYTLRKDAAWSDGVPIRAEDFSYLHDEMSSQTGVVDPAGYRLISGISARQGGTVAVVRFSKPYPEWRSLFTDLLPAHLLKDAPGGWAGALATGYPASGGPFALRSVDPVRGEIVLQRNDRYWAKPSVLDGITLLGSDPSGLARSLREGGDQLASVADSSTSAAALQALRGHGVAVRSVPRAAVAQVILRSPELLLR